MLDTSRSRFMSIEFVKKDGTRRKMVINPRAVATHLAKNPSEAGKRAAETRRVNHPNLIPVYEVGKGIKSINTDTVLSVRMGGSEYLIGCATTDLQTCHILAQALVVPRTSLRSRIAVFGPGSGSEKTVM